MQEEERDRNLFTLFISISFLNIEWRNLLFFKFSALIWISVWYTQICSGRRSTHRKHFLDGEDMKFASSDGDCACEWNARKLVMIELCWAFRTTVSTFGGKWNKMLIFLLRWERYFESIEPNTKYLIAFLQVPQILLKLMSNKKSLIFERILFAIPLRTMPKIRWNFYIFPLLVS